MDSVGNRDFTPAVAAVFTRHTLEACTPYIHFSDVHYAKRILERTPGHEVVLICWRAGQRTPIHDHPEGGCWMSVLQGCLEETEYTKLGEAKLGEAKLGEAKLGEAKLGEAKLGEAKLGEAKRLFAGSFGYKQGPDGIHRIRALEDTVSLHLYMPSGYVARTYMSGDPSE